MPRSWEYLLAGFFQRCSRETVVSTEMYLYHLPNVFVVELARCLLHAQFPDSSEQEKWVFEHCNSTFPYHKICTVFFKNGGVPRYIKNFALRFGPLNQECIHEHDNVFEDAAQDDLTKLGVAQKQWYLIHCDNVPYKKFSHLAWKFLCNDVTMDSLCMFIHEEVQSSYDDVVAKVDVRPVVVAIRAVPARRPIDHLKQMYQITWDSMNYIAEVELEVDDKGNKMALIRPWFMGYFLGVRVLRECSETGQLWFGRNCFARSCTASNSEHSETGLPQVPLFSSFYTCKWDSKRSDGSDPLIDTVHDFKRFPGVFEGVVLYLRVHHTRLHPLMDLYRSTVDSVLSSDVDDLFDLITRFPSSSMWENLRARLERYRNELIRVGLIREAAVLFHASTIPEYKRFDSISKLRKELIQISDANYHSVFKYTKAAMKKLKQMTETRLKSAPCFPRVHHLWGRVASQPFYTSESDIMAYCTHLRASVQNGLQAFSDRYPELMANVNVLHVDYVKVSVPKFRDTVLHGLNWCYDTPELPLQEVIVAEQDETTFIEEDEDEDEWEGEDFGSDETEPQDSTQQAAKYLRTGTGATTPLCSPSEDPRKLRFSTKRPSPLFCTLCPPNPTKQGDVIIARIRLMEKEFNPDQTAFDKTLTAMVQHLGQCMNQPDLLTVSDAGSTYIMPMDLVSMESNKVAARGVPFIPWKTDPQSRRLHIAEDQVRSLRQMCTRDSLLSDYSSVLSVDKEERTVLKGLYQYKSVSRNRKKSRGKEKTTRHADFAVPIIQALGKPVPYYLSSCHDRKNCIEVGTIREVFAKQRGAILSPRQNELLTYKGQPLILDQDGITHMNLCNPCVQDVCSRMLLYAGMIGNKLSCYDRQNGSRRVHSYLSWGFLAWHTFYGESILPECAPWTVYDAYIAEQLLHPVLGNVSSGQLWRVDYNGPAFDHCEQLVHPNEESPVICRSGAKEMQLLQQRLGRGFYLPRAIAKDKIGDERRLLECSYWSFCDATTRSQDARAMLDQLSPMSTMQTRAMKTQTLKSHGKTTLAKRMITTLEHDGEAPRSTQWVVHSGAQLHAQLQDEKSRLRLTSLNFFVPVLLNTSRSEGLCFNHDMLDRDHREVVEFRDNLLFIYDLARGARGSLVHEMNAFLTRCTQSSTFTGTLAPIRDNLSLTSATTAFELLNFIVHYTGIVSDIPHFDFEKTKPRFEAMLQKSRTPVVVKPVVTSFLETCIQTCADYVTNADTKQSVFDF